MLRIFYIALRGEDSFQQNREENTETTLPGLMQVLPFSQAPCPQTTVISAVLRSFHTTNDEEILF